jgi:hypothetical protein
MKLFTTLLAAACAPAAMAAAIATTTSINSFSFQQQAPGCEKLIYKAGGFTFGPTKTVWTETETVTQTIDCGGCDRVLVTQLPMGPGLVIFYENTTTVAEPSLTTTYLCEGADKAEARKTIENKPQETVDKEQPTATGARQAQAAEEEEAVGKSSKEPTKTEEQQSKKAGDEKEPAPKETEQPKERRAEQASETSTGKSPENSEAATKGKDAETTPRLWGQPEAYVTTTLTPEQRSTPICTAQTELDGPIPDSTLTVYPSTVTSFSTIECFGCEWQYWTGAINLFAAVTLTSTITVNTPSTKIDLTCSASATR